MVQPNNKHVHQLNVTTILCLSGLCVAEANARVKRYGLNEIARKKPQSPLMRLLDNVKNPLVIPLTALCVLSYLTGDLRATVVILVMIVLGVSSRFYQEMRADNAAEKLKAMVDTLALWCGTAKKPNLRSSSW
jgi:P-type Mg2+ transporter